MNSYFLTRAYMPVLRLGMLAFTMLLASCGSSTVNDPFKPTRVIVFGDSFSFISTTAAFTVNDSSTNNWARQIAANYSVTNIVSNAAANALVADVLTQVNNFGSNYQAGDLVIVSAGYRDIINNAVSGGASTSTATTSGQAYASLVRTMVSNGAKRIAVANLYDLSKAPVALVQTNLGTQNSNNRGALIAAFNDALKSSLGSSTLTYIGDNVRLLDTEAYFNTIRATPNVYSFVDTTTVTCTAVGTGVGLGAGKVDSSQCTAANATGGTATTYTSPAYNNYVFADSVYPTPAFHRAWGNNSYGQLVSRW